MNGALAMEEHGGTSHISVTGNKLNRKWLTSVTGDNVEKENVQIFSIPRSDPKICIQIGSKMIRILIHLLFCKDSSVQFSQDSDCISF